MKFTFKSVFVCFLLSLVAATCSLAAEFDGTSDEQWQIQRLFHPTEKQLVAEREGSVMIYAGLKDTTVSQAMDQYFDRIDSMMFVRTVVTEDDGQPTADPESGDDVVEDDGC